MKIEWKRWIENPVHSAFLTSVLFSAILVPYWWLAYKWSISFFSDPATRFTFISTSCILILAIIDGAFLIRYYQIVQKNRLAFALKQLEIGSENYRSLIEHAPFPIIVTKLSDQTILLINNEATKLFAINPDEKFGKIINYQILNHEKLQQFTHMMSEKKQIENFEIPFYAKTGELVYASLSANIINYLGEKAIFTAIVNITERVTLEQEIIKREEKFSTFFHEVPNPLIILSESGEILEVNSCYEQYFQMSTNELVGKNLNEMQIFSEINIDFIFADDNQQPSPIETIIELPGGQNRYVILHTRQINIQNVSRILLLIQDIDDMKRTQNAISKANNQLSILNSVTRHDILNRIMIITSFGKFLEQNCTDEPEKRWISILMKSADDIQTLIDFTHQYQDLGVNPPKWQNVTEIMKKKSIRLLLSDIVVHEPVESYEIYVDPLFEKVMYNLVDNSIRHGEHVTDITLSYERNDPYLIFRYEDNGVGIDDTDKKNIFQKGFGKNTGLGLFLIREIVSLTGIQITETGEKGFGVRFDMKIQAGSFRAGQTNTKQTVSQEHDDNINNKIL